jgi:hypothetical protein
MRFTIDQIGRSPPTHRRDPAAGAVKRLVDRRGAIAAPNEIQFNGIGGLRTYIAFMRIGDQSSR